MDTVLVRKYLNLSKSQDRGNIYNTWEKCEFGPVLVNWSCPSAPCYLSNLM